MSSVRADLLLLLMRAGSGLSERINAAVVAAGYRDLRPAHGLTFVRVSRGDATINDVAAFLGVTKQSAAAIVDQLVRNGYVTREPHPGDRRAQLVRLTGRGRHVTEVANRAATEQWRQACDQYGTEQMANVVEVLEGMGYQASPHPVW